MTGENDCLFTNGSFHSPSKCVGLSSADSDPNSTNGPSSIVHTTFGDIRGFQYQIDVQRKAEIFLGIPFAKPPIGELRFEKPVPPAQWHPNVLQAVAFGPASFPLNFGADPSLPCSEDCLYLNIFRPCSIAAVTNSPLLPVMIYIHGGGFAYGSTREYGFKGWTRNFVPEGILVVTIQYRLGALGFLTLGNGSAIPGNLGLWDMAAALHFVHEQIHSFGGDPRRVTVIGLSAGGAAAASMALSPHTRDWLFSTVEMSGTALAEWSGSQRTVDCGREFVRRVLGIGEEHEVEWTNRELTEQLKAKLKALNLKQIMSVAMKMTTRMDTNLLVWGPNIDGDFFPRDFPQLLREIVPPKPVLMGLTGKEAIYFTIQGKDAFINPFGLSSHQMSMFDTFAFRAFVENVVLNAVFRRHIMASDNSTVKEAADDICAFYLDSRMQSGNMPLELANIFHLEAYTRLVSDLMFNVPLFWKIRTMRECGARTYLYLNTYFNPVQFERDIRICGATHGNEYPYMNGLFPVGEFTFNDSDIRHRDMLLQMLTNFVRTGHPSINELKSEWPSNCNNTNNDRFKFVQFAERDGKCTIGNGDEAMIRSERFWSDFGRKYGFDIVRGIEIGKNELA